MTKTDAEKLVEELTCRFGGDAESEEVNPGQFRFTLTSPRFTGLSHLRRQDQAWSVIDQTLTPEQIQDFTLILLYSPDERVMAPNG